MKFFTTAFVLFLFSISLSAQNIEWQKVLHGNNPFNPGMGQSRLTLSADGYWAAYLEQHRLTYGQDFLGDHKIVHFDKNGMVTDSLIIGGKSHVKLLHHQNGRLYMWVGFFDSMSVGSFTFKAKNNYRTWLGYRDSNGIHDLGTMDDTVSALTILPSGHVALATMFPNYLHIFTPLGGFHESHALPGTGFLHHIEPLPGGAMLITGSCLASLVKFDSIDIQNPHSYTNYILYLDQQRTARWLRFIEDITCISSVAVASGNDIYWAGSTYIQPQFDSLNYKGGPSISFEDFFLAKMNAGKYNWVKEIPGDSVFAGMETGATKMIGTDPSGNVYLMGTFRGNSVKWNATYTTGSLNNSYNVLLTSWAPDGTLRWAKDMGGSGLEMAHEMVVSGTDELVFTAMLTDTFVFENQTINADYGDVWVVKIMGSPAWTKESLKNGTALQLYPNPAQDVIFHNLSVPQAYEIFSSAGSTVGKGVLWPGKALGVQELAPGMYIVKSGSGSCRFMKM